MPKSPRDTLKQLSDRYVSHLNSAGMNVAQMAVVYKTCQEETGNDYSEYIALCQSHVEALASFEEMAVDLRNRV